MEITYLGHSAFRLRGKDVSIVTDPFSPDSGLNMGKPSANIVTESRQSPHHSYSDGVGGVPRVIAGPGEYEVADVLVAGVATAQEPMKGPTNTAYVFRLEELTICHLGHLEDKLTDQQVEEIGSINVLMIPVGGGGALAPSEAAEVVSQLEPALVIPMHYHLEGSRIEGLEPVDAFCREVGLKEYVAEPKLTVTKSTLPQNVRIVVLENKRA